MDHFRFVDVGIAIDNLFNEAYCFFLFEGSLFLNLGSQVSSFTVLSDDEDHAVSVVLRDDLYDVEFISKLPEDIEFLYQFLFFVGIVQVFFGVAFEDERRQIRVNSIDSFVDFGISVGCDQTIGILIIIDTN